jgi:hypothetical protein
VSSCSRIRSMASKMTSTSTGARPGEGQSGNSGLGFPFCIILASVEGRLVERDAWLFVAADRELPVGSSDNWAGG